MLSKVNPMDKEFVPPSLTIKSIGSRHCRLMPLPHVAGAVVRIFGYNANGFLMQQHLNSGVLIGNSIRSLVMYPIINLRYHKMDLHWYLRALEEVVIRVLSSTFAIEASRIEGLTGVWVGDQKLAAIGIRVSQWITYHGLALNVSLDLSPFQKIVPCGIQDRRVGSIKELLRKTLPSNSCRLENNNHVNDNELIEIAHESLIREFCEVFKVDLQYKHTLSELSEG
ncbi:unnamed protein product [Fraxinus pennsylvanica]|uniref:lipoyl(octanoyl) transferase n=1 Tax=Fraxinus pennsylvanica TaxID=56036 RepID=A0AAD2DIW2_9LAMI|nr:unnamed protein product [Fraxinus pennsylvanica]